MGTIILYHGSGAGDFEIVGDPGAGTRPTRTFFNARRLLTVRGQTDAITLLDAAAFTVFPATNHFNDDFDILKAEVPLQAYEEFRLNEKTYKAAAKQMVEAFQEAGGPYIRFLAISLQLADPEAWDVFICHASDDKETVARPLYEHLMGQGIHCWLDEAEIAWGESIVAKIQEGLRLARYVIVVLSAELLKKKWAPRELQAALTLEIDSGKNIVLPLIVGSADAVLAPLPFIRDKLYLHWDGKPAIVEKELQKLVRRQR
jgi:hypothetical protein